MLVENVTQRARKVAIWISPRVVLPQTRRAITQSSPRSFNNHLASTKATVTAGPVVNGESHPMVERSCSALQHFECFLAKSLSVQALFRLAFIFFPAVKTKSNAYQLPFLLDYPCYLLPWGDAERPQTEHRCPDGYDQDTKTAVLSQRVYNLISHLHWMIHLSSTLSVDMKSIAIFYC